MDKDRRIELLNRLNEGLDVEGEDYAHLCCRLYYENPRWKETGENEYTLIFDVNKEDAEKALQWDKDGLEDFRNSEMPDEECIRRGLLLS